MELIIKKNKKTKKGLFGKDKGILFSLIATLKLTEEEINSINTYQLNDWKIAKFAFDGDERETGIYISELIEGNSEFTSEYPEKILELEEAIKSGCLDIKNYITIADNFNKEESFEI